MAGKSPQKDSTKKDKAGRAVASPIPTRALLILFTAFGGALGLKAWEERRSANDALRAQQSREAMAIASYARSEINRAQAAFETALEMGHDVTSAAAAADLKSPRAVISPADGMMAQLSASDTIDVFAKDVTGNWWSASLNTASLMPSPAGGRSFSLVDGIRSTAGASIDGLTLQSRRVQACAPVNGSSASVCVTRDVPMLDVSDYNRFLIYFLLLAAPALAVHGLIGTIRTNSKRLVVEHENRTELENRWEEVEIGGNAGLWTLDNNTDRIQLRKQSAEMLGLPKASTLDVEAFLQLVHETYRDRLRDFLERKAGEFQLEFPGSGAYAKRHFDMRGGHTKKGLGGVITDVTDRVRAQTRSRRAEQLTRAAVEAFPGPFAAWDSRRRLLLWNSAFERMFDLPKGVMRIGASHDSIMAEANRQIRVERPISGSRGAREILLLSDVWLNYQDQPMPNGGTISVGIDVSPLKEHEERLGRSEKKLKRLVGDLDRTQGQTEVLNMRLAEQKARAERASQSKSVFLANMSHELRTPLNAINGFSEMLLKEIYGPLGDERYKGYAEDILASGQHLLDMINDILDMAKIEAGKMSISTDRIDPVDPVDAAVRMMRRRANDKEMELELTTAQHLPEISGDHRAIKQMSLNLISNAIKFTDRGGHIGVHISNEGKFIRVSVTDNGIGIPAKDLPRLASPFEQSSADEHRNSKGSGLGLSLTKSFAEMHGGQLFIESEFGKGTKVSFTLPIDSPPRNKSEDHSTINAN